MAADCLYWSKTERRYLLACVDDMCHNSGTTLCGLEHGYDFDVQEDDDEDDYYDEGPSMLPAGHNGSLDG